MIQRPKHILLVGLFAFRTFTGKLVMFLIEYLNKLPKAKSPGYPAYGGRSMLRFEFADVHTIMSCNKYSLKALKRRFRAGNLLSRLIRPIFEIKQIKTVFGAQLAAAVITVGSLGIPFAETSGLAYPEAGKTEVVLEVNQAVLITEEVGFQVPVKEFMGVSQGFHAEHPALDMRAPLGSEVVPINNGVVKEIIHSSYGYGRRVIVDHGEGLVSLYAHMGKIAVDEGDEVDKEDVLGEVGLTGWTTGPHIHLEIYKDGVVVNPGRYLVI